MSKKEIRKIRLLLAFFIGGLFLSGLTAIPIDLELTTLLKIIPSGSILFYWLQKVLLAYQSMNKNYPFLLYGYDWLAFAHFVLAVLFIGPYRDPVKNIWAIEFGLIACLLVFPFAFMAGHFRGILIGWQLIDCSFGVAGFVPLWICYRKIKSIESKTNL